MSKKGSVCGWRRIVVSGFVVLLATVPLVVSGQRDPIVPSEHNISALVSDIWTSFPQAGGQGDMAPRGPQDMCMDSKGRIFVLDYPNEGLEPARIVS